MKIDEKLHTLIKNSSDAKDRYELLTNVIKIFGIERICEVGVWRANLTEYILLNSNVKKLIAIDPWKNLTDWKKPNNLSDKQFDQIYQEVVNKLSIFEGRVQLERILFRDAVHLEGADIGLFYIDADHTLRGIYHDLEMARRINPKAVLVLDDVCPNIWQHGTEFDPTLVWPFALYFAEFHNYTLILMPHNQCLLIPTQVHSFHNYSLIDYSTGKNVWSFPKKSLRKLLKYLVNLSKKIKKLQ